MVAGGPPKPASTRFESGDSCYFKPTEANEVCAATYATNEGNAAEAMRDTGRDRAGGLVQREDTSPANWESEFDSLDLHSAHLRQYGAIVGIDLVADATSAVGSTPVRTRYGASL
jgi:hypothetical protein